ncbi:DUF5671 domain-containing protein [Pontivivens insulae]|uniref:DUF5671 domain-containing protein n=1 Tax=Pontivivens insulae TaxID=1639689 RepID=A0A2R8AE49_9RHOB|nr:DUF5671 domain-containing protein [Pontivivens insulae]RED11786.1 hypothetical protein DFR53_2496 [Pontivivens insulae]SPF30543.1 hypothetical protein POI8812_02882 [Pontivivens insulae]
MSNTKLLSQYVEGALNAGLSHSQVRAHLEAADWPADAIEDALGEWAEIDVIPPVPRARAVFSVLDLFTYLALLVMLALTAFYMISLSLGLIEYAFDPPSASSWQSDHLASSARWALAIIVVAAPIYGLLVRWTDRDVMRNPVKRTAGVRRFAIGLTMLISAAVFVGDLVFVVYSFLQGDVTIAFLLKALVVAAVALALLAIGREDLSAQRGRFKRPLLWAGAGATVLLIILTVLALGSPREVRSAQQDREAYDDLTRIAVALQCPDEGSAVLPETLTPAALAQFCDGVRLRFAAEPDAGGAPPYAYTRIGETGFTLCSEFGDAAALEGRRTWTPDGFWFFNTATGCVEGSIRAAQ